MYVGRIVAVGRNRKGQLAVLYRVSSRSFPNREARIKENAVAIVPKKGAEGDVFKSPYVAYNCLRIAGRTAVAANGSHTDPIAEKVAAGMPVRDALAVSLLALDYEKDAYNTPRIAAAATAGSPAAAGGGQGGDAGYLGVVREDGLDVCRIRLEPGECFYVSTYETNRVSLSQRDAFDAADAREGAEFILRGGVFAGMSNAVCGVCAIEKDGRFEIAVAQA